jgi:hypothetical protein
MEFLPDPVEMTAEERFLELAAILARGYLRLRKRALPADGVTSPDRNSRLDSLGEPTPSLDLGHGPRVHVQVSLDTMSGRRFGDDGAQEHGGRACGTPPDDGG